MQGIINVYKEAGMTSFDVIAKLRKIFNEKKIGHTGTLDPNATGVLPICIGNATKFVPYIMSFNKQYIAIIKLGIQTDTGDITGKVINQNITPYIKIEDIQKAINSFFGKIQQKPPMYSAIKINGQKLCNLARKGIEVERPLREIEIFDISIITYDKENSILTLKIDCSKGTYIRTLAEDICFKLNTIGTLISLERTKTGSFSKETAHTLSDIANSVNNNEIDNIL
ncbi:MAG: tRNA pseudouridine(55) synthase TruB, partial [Clostridia bacterium]|nr:tRNA pseudouridine(55) synthase TruB [Clostridia bacterium]